MSMRSELAQWKPAERVRTKTMEPWGFLIHTSGRGIVERAQKQGRPAIELALEWYRDKDRSGVHYTVGNDQGYDGQLYQMLEDNIYGAHVGISSDERTKYLNGTWVNHKDITATAVAQWKERWPTYKSPQHLYPTTSPNGCYIGIEMVPLMRARDNGLWFTDAQHEAVQRLANDLAKRHGWPEDWVDTPRLVGHEDVDAFARWDKNGGWDPGAMRLSPRFDWDAIKAPLDEAPVESEFTEAQRKEIAEIARAVLLKG